jgi:dinuclear metal center YbgI/SA1388 family protein
MKIKDVLKVLEAFAPLPLQEHYDHAGLQVGDGDRVATGALICLDVTEQTVHEAVETQCNLIIAHHPLIFKPVQSVTGRNYIERCIHLACKHDVAIYAAHTNLDNAAQGVNHKLAQILGLQNTKILSPLKEKLLKLVTFVPNGYADTLRNALFQAGAGHIGKYDLCSFYNQGSGTYRAGDDAKPFKGWIGVVYQADETRIETVLPVFLKNQVQQALIENHPYEEPVFDFYMLENEWNTVGTGVVGELQQEQDTLAFLQFVKEKLSVKCLRHSIVMKNKVKKIALCGGSGASLIPHAIADGADVFITGEAKYNDFHDVENKITLAVTGHYESEICTQQIFIELLSKKIPTFAAQIAQSNFNPVQYL